MTNDLVFVTGKPFFTRNGTTKFIPIELYSRDRGQPVCDQVATAYCDNEDGTGWQILQCNPVQSLSLIDPEKALTVDEVADLIEGSDVYAVLPRTFWKYIVTVRTIAGLALYVDTLDTTPELVVNRSEATPMTKDEAKDVLSYAEQRGLSRLPGIYKGIPGDEISSMYIEPLVQAPVEQVGDHFDMPEALEGSAVPRQYFEEYNKYIKDRFKQRFGNGAA